MTKLIYGIILIAFLSCQKIEEIPDINNAKKNELLDLVNNPDSGSKYFVLNATPDKIFTPVIKEPAYFNLINDAAMLANKQIVMVDEHSNNKQIAEAIQKSNQAFFEYHVWKTDHSFTNKRVSLMNKVIAFLDK